jgi:hypothetical protein
MHAQIIVNPKPSELRDASATLLYVACPEGPLLALHDCSRGINARARPVVAPEATAAEMLTAAAAAADAELAAHHRILQALGLGAAEALKVPAQLAGAAVGRAGAAVEAAAPGQAAGDAACNQPEALPLDADEGVDEGLPGALWGAAGGWRPGEFTPRPWPTLAPPPRALVATHAAAHGHLQALFSQQHLPRSAQLQALADIEVRRASRMHRMHHMHTTPDDTAWPQGAVREELLLRGLVRHWTRLGGADSPALTTHMLPAAFHTVLCDAAVRHVAAGGARPCRAQAARDMRPLGGGKVARLQPWPSPSYQAAAASAPPPSTQDVSVSASAVIWVGGTQVSGTSVALAPRVNVCVCTSSGSSVRAPHSAARMHSSVRDGASMQVFVRAPPSTACMHAGVRNGEPAALRQASVLGHVCVPLPPLGGGNQGCSVHSLAHAPP